METIKKYEENLPPTLEKSLKERKESLERMNRGEEDYHWDIYFGNLQSDINAAEVNHAISSEQAWYLREKYLGMERV